MPVNTTAYYKVKKALDAASVTLVAVSKTKTAADIMSLYDLGQRDFGENYVQELLEKQEALPTDIRWHFIGHLQTNKVKYIAPFVYMIHAVDSEKLLGEINKQGAANNRKIPCLLQVHISKDENKFGFDELELSGLIDKIFVSNNLVKNVAVQGLMAMATFTEDNALIVEEFQRMKKIFDSHKNELAASNSPLSILSMGMSADYTFAVDAGSTMVRIGSLLFGSRA